MRGTHTYQCGIINQLATMFILVFATQLALTKAIKEEFGRRNLGTQNNPGYISIDCGVENDYLNGERGIHYKSDKEFVNSGENHNAMQGAEDAWMLYINLRSFPQGKRNCYTLKPEQPNNHYLIRAFFLYGNYDGKNQTPVFDLYIGADYWFTLNLPSPLSLIYYNIIYFLTEDSLNVCLVNIGSGIPFISALELRPAISNASFFNNGNRTTFGALEPSFYDVGITTDSSLSYKDDMYDRIWVPKQVPGSIAVRTSESIVKQGNNDLPEDVLKTGIEPPNGSTTLTYDFSLTSFTDQRYVVLHFAGITDAASGLLREFTVSLNDFKTKPIRVEYLKALSLSSQNLTIEGSIKLTLEATSRSVLPPILNAVEIYKVLQFSFSSTHQSDVDAILAIKHTYKMNMGDWQGDPCLPKEYAWSGLGCSYNTTPRIISLNMSGNKLTGEISSSFSNLQALEMLDISYNELSGPVPEVLAQLPYLKVLNLSGNKLNVYSIPQSLKIKSDNGSLLLSLSGNYEKGPREENNKKFIVPVVASIISALALLILVAVLIIFYRTKGRKRDILHTNTSNKRELLVPKNRPFTYSEISRITVNFKIEIGEGGFGKVFLGHLNGDSPVAVKLLSASSKQGYKEFQSEAQLLMIVNHKNLVSLIGYCKEEDNMALVYEFLSNGNLKQHLSDKNETCLSWKQRLKIAVDAAQGLDYLHNGCKPPIVHRDLKTSNILLSESMQAKIADFGLSRAFTELDSHISTCPAGTLGYLDPEFRASGNLNKKSDVYSFGVILFELITGKPAIIRSADRNMLLLQWVHPFIQNGDIGKIVDPWLQNEFDTNTAWKVVEIAMSCVQPTSVERPDMSAVLAELKECLDINSCLEMNSLVMEVESVPKAR